MKEHAAPATSVAAGAARQLVVDPELEGDLGKGVRPRPGGGSLKRPCVVPSRSVLLASRPGCGTATGGPLPRPSATCRCAAPRLLPLRAHCTMVPDVMCRDSLKLCQLCADSANFSTHLAESICQPPFFARKTSPDGDDGGIGRDVLPAGDRSGQVRSSPVRAMNRNAWSTLVGWSRHCLFRPSRRPAAAPTPVR